MVLIIILTVLFSIATVLCVLKGYKLDLFSSKSISESRFLRFMPVRWLVYWVSGFIWSLAKLHLPGVELMVTYGFDNTFGAVLRRAYWKCRIHRLGKDVIIAVGAKAIGWQNISIGDNSVIDRNVILEAGSIDSRLMVYSKKHSSLVEKGKLIIGKGCHISKNVVIQSYGGIFIGDFTGIASGAKVYSLSHHYKNMMEDDGKIYKFTPYTPYEEQSLIEGSIIFEGNNALGLNSVVLPGVILGMNSWVGVCSYVVDDVPPDSLVVGCPAKVVKFFQRK
jgi:acetyltransferase-like isoleucine patch superfamily enzyme